VKKGGAAPVNEKVSDGTVRGRLGPVETAVGDRKIYAERGTASPRGGGERSPRTQDSEWELGCKKSKGSGIGDRVRCFAKTGGGSPEISRKILKDRRSSDQGI